MYKFDIDTVIGQAVTSSKTVTGLIQPEAARKAVEAVIEANAAFTKSVFAAFTGYTDAVQKVAVK